MASNANAATGATNTQNAAFILSQFDQKTQYQALTLLRQLNAQQQIQQIQHIKHLHKFQQN